MRLRRSTGSPAGRLAVTDTAAHLPPPLPPPYCALTATLRLDQERHNCVAQLGLDVGPVSDRESQSASPGRGLACHTFARRHSNHAHGNTHTYTHTHARARSHPARPHTRDPRLLVAIPPSLPAAAAPVAPLAATRAASGDLPAPAFPWSLQTRVRSPAPPTPPRRAQSWPPTLTT